jgi:hypothetical protein
MDVMYLAYVPSYHLYHLSGMYPTTCSTWSLHLVGPRHLALLFQYALAETR